jgi:predicted nucleic-acid-binding protein
VIGVDTNLLVRHLVEDDAAQVSRVRRLFDEIDQADGRIFVDDVVLCELVWALRSIYGWKREAIAEGLEKILGRWLFMFADPELFNVAIGDYRHGRGDFADYLIGRRNAAAGCEHTVTFDKDLAAHPAFRRPLGIRRQNPEPPPRRRAEGPKVALVERQHVARVVALGEHDDRGVGEADVQIAVALDDLACSGNVEFVEDRQLVDAALDLLEQRDLGWDAGVFRDQGIELGEDEWRQDSRRGCLAQRAGALLVPVLVGEERGEQAARVEKDHRPKPSSNSSARSAMSGAPRP